MYNKPISSSELRELIKDCREQLTQDLMSENSEELESRIDDLDKKFNKKGELKKHFSAKKLDAKIKKMFVDEMLSDKIIEVRLQNTTNMKTGHLVDPVEQKPQFNPAKTFHQYYHLEEYTEDSYLEKFKNKNLASLEKVIVRWTSPLGEKKVFVSKTRSPEVKYKVLKDLPLLEKVNPDVTRLAFSYNNLEMSLGLVPTEVDQLVDPNLQFLNIKPVINLDNNQITIIQYKRDRSSGDKIILKQESFPLGQAKASISPQSYLDGRLMWKAQYEFNCRFSSSQ